MWGRLSSHQALPLCPGVARPRPSPLPALQGDGRHRHRSLPGSGFQTLPSAEQDQGFFSQDLTRSQANLGVLPQGPPPPHPHGTPTNREEEPVRKGGGAGCRPAAHRARRKGDSLRFPACSRVFTETAHSICDQKKQYLNYIHES